MEDSDNMLSNEGFIGGGAEPDRDPMQVSNSEFELSSLHLTVRNDPESWSRKMAGQVMSRETNWSRSGILEESFPVVDLTTRMRGIEELRKFDRVDAVDQNVCQTTERFQVFCSAYLSVFEGMNRKEKMLMERMENLDRQNTFHGTPVPERICLPLPASIPSNKTHASPDPQEQTKNEPINQEPVPEVNAGKEQRYGKVKGIQPLGIDEMPVDLLDGPSVPLLIGITATDVLSMGRGSQAVEVQVSYFSDSSFIPTSQNGRVWRKCDICCCSIM